MLIRACLHEAWSKCHEGDGDDSLTQFGRLPVIRQEGQ